MSYDIWTTAPEDDEGFGFDWNYTSNVITMTAKAGLRTLSDLDGVSVRVAALALETVIARMEADPDGYRDLNPQNGWGDYDGFLQRLRDLRDHLLEVPEGATVRVG